MIYMDNAATSFPKAPGVKTAMLQYFTDAGGNPGRGGHSLARSTDTAVENTRHLLKELFGATTHKHCIFSSNATDSIHIALQGILKNGDTVAYSPLIHNSLFRPLHLLESKDFIQTRPLEIDRHKIQPSHLKKVLEEGVQLVVLSHMCNVSGIIEDIAEIGEIIKAYPQTLFLVDAAQSAGHIGINIQDMNIDLLIITGHKGLLGPAGSGALILSSEAAERIEAHRVGGSGIDSEDPFQPHDLPWRLEAGTPNIPSIIGLGEAISYLISEGIDTLHQKSLALSEELYEGLKNIPGIRIFTDTKQPFIISFDHPQLEVSQWGALLDQEFNIACRTGLHCSPGIHKHMGTYPQGLVRLSPSVFNQKVEIEKTIKAVREICGI